MDDDLINRIISGYQLIKYNKKIYKLAKPGTDLKIAANILYQEQYEENLFSNFVLKQDINNILISSGIIAKDFEEKLNITEKSLEKAKIDLFKNFYTPSQKNKAKNRISAISKALNQAYSEKHSFDFLILENYCENIKNEYIIANSLYVYDHQNLVFKNYPNIDYVLFNEITQNISKNIISVTEYKKLARSEEWRKIYSAGDVNIFSGPTSEYTEEQKALISISKMYDKIYEHPECPDQEIIEDDDALDGWMLHHQQENKRRKIEKGVDKSLGKHAGAGEVFLMAGNNQQEINQVMELNSPQALNKINARTKIAAGQQVEDVDFDDTRNEIRQKIQELNQRK